MNLQQINKACRHIKGVRGQLIVDAFNEIFPLYGVTTKQAQAALISNLVHESASLIKFEENLNYSVKGLLNTFSRTRITKNQCEQYGRVDGVKPANKKAIANTVYGGSWGKLNLGNTQPNDGYELRGSGALQLTGRSVISSFTHYYNNRFGTFYNIIKMSEMLRDPANIKISIHAACWFITTYKNLLTVANNGNVAAFRKGINGGYNGLDEVRYYHNRLLAEL